MVCFFGILNLSDRLDMVCGRAAGALFERLYVIKDGVVAMQGGKGPSDYFVGAVSEWLEDEVGARGFDAEGL